MEHRLTVEELTRDVGASEFLRHFYEISQIPRPSGAPEQISNYLVEFARKNHFEYEQDETYNVIIRKPATPGHETSPSVILAAHMDMISEKDPEIEHDFFNDPIELVREGDKVFARGTTLGADDGIGCAYMMAILEDKESPHPAIEAVFTVDEETDMKGAARLDYSKLQSKLVLNLDGRDLCGAAAGEMELRMDLPMEKEKIKEGSQLFTLTVHGLLGGHSGTNAMCERGNAIVLLDRILLRLDNIIDYQILKVDGGTQLPSAFARNAACLLATAPENEEKLIAVADEMCAQFRIELMGRDEIKVSVNQEECGTLDMAFTEGMKDKMLQFLLMIPDGLYTRDHVHEGHIQGSSNTGVLKTLENSVHIATLIRSHIPSIKDFLYQKFDAICKMIGLELTVDHDLPPFAYSVDEKLNQLLLEVYPDLELGICDACTECGLLASNIENSIVVSLPLAHYFAHSTNEHFFIKDAEKRYLQMVELLGKL